MYNEIKRKGKPTDFDYSKICRSCLTERGHLKHIFSSSISKMIEFSMSTQIFENDDLPQQICVTCFHQIAKFYHFKKRFEKIDKVLRNHAKKATENANEENEEQSENEYIEHVLKCRFNKVQTGKGEILMKESKVSQVCDTDIPNNTTNVNTKQGVRKKEEAQREAAKRETLPFQEHSSSDNENATSFLSTNQPKNITEEIITDDLTPIFTDGPPPLVPLPSCKVALSATPKIVPFEHTLKNLPQDTPPLIPIKPMTPLLSQLTNSSGQDVADLKVPMRCTICSETFPSILDLKHHRTVACQPASLHCNICKKKFNDRKRLIGHLKGHMITKDYECQLCEKRYPNPSTFRVHMRTHTGERPFKCQICNKGFTRYAGVIGHMRTHSPEKPYQCGTCGRCFKVLSNLERHKAIHMESMPFCCSYCGKTFSQSENLNLHIRSCHTHERPFLCSECGKGFVSSNRLNRHMWVHTGYKPYKCKCCTKAYTNSNDLKNHQRTHLGGPTPDDKPFACSLCNMRFFHRCRLVKHMKVHDKRFACEDCFKVFSSEVLLNRHKGKHKMSMEGSEKPITYPIEVFIV